MIIAKWTGKAYGVNKRLDTTRYGRIYASHGYKGFKEGLAWVLRAANHRHVTFEGPVRVDVWYVMRHDLDALTKPVMDAIALAGIVKNDKQIAERHEYRKWKTRLRDLDEIEITIRRVKDED